MTAKVRSEAGGGGGVDLAGRGGGGVDLAGRGGVEGQRVERHRRQRRGC